MRCDCHMHIVGPADTYPQLPSRTYLADVATLETVRRLGAPRGVTRFVVVQASFYGSDNTLLLESLDTLRGDGRGVVVIDASMSQATFDDFARRGVRGVRLNLYSTAGRADAKPLDKTFAELAAVAQRMRWHVEVIASLDVLARHHDLLARSPAPVVVDHYGVYGNATPEDANARRLLDLLRQPHVWMKLSAPYRVSSDPLATRPDKRWLDAILACAEDRCVWGSDWRHTPPHDLHKGPDVVGPYRTLSYERLLDDFVAALGSDARADRILRDNAARLYEF
ncbi:MAG: amidohydrolase family protein [Rhizobiales bacterium]|nr:amidohydrolase family protein [Hyphomicrobiales bacterium]